MRVADLQDISAYDDKLLDSRNAPQTFFNLDGKTCEGNSQRHRDMTRYGGLLRIRNTP
jgi:hypothetical protein